MAAEVALNGEPVDAAAAGRLLGLAGPWTGGDISANLLAEYRYRQLQLADVLGDEPARREHARWIVRHAPGSSFELPALIIVARALDEQLRQEKSVSTESLEEGFQVYRQLLAQFGDGPEVLKAKKNAQVAASRLADYADRLGRHAEASRLLANLLAAFPSDTGYLRRAGLADWRAGNHARSIEHWRVLVAGLPKDSDEWFEAKYYQLASLARLDPAQARESLQQFELLYPQFGSPAWRDRFSELQQSLGK
jgi:tetratricopeptide (TPR) repeat protein